ncbi:serine/threonine-protein kinase [Embleya sp. NPDC001921]
MEPLRAGDPRWLGRFRLLGRLGSGGMGRVFLGREPGGAVVAVKLVHPDLLEQGGPEFRRRFEREVRAARSVPAEFTATLVDADPGAEVPWLATRFVVGIPLDEAVARFGPPPENSLRELAAGLFAALAGFHTAELVHRDMKPANVMLAVDGPKVIDFGIALPSGATDLTRTGHTVGTLGFMSPEQFERSDVGPESDVFSCAAVLAYAATGRPPFPGDTLPVLFANLTLREPDLDDARPRSPPRSEPHSPRTPPAAPPPGRPSHCSPPRPPGSAATLAGCHRP